MFRDDKSYLPEQILGLLCHRFDIFHLKYIPNYIVWDKYIEITIQRPKYANFNSIRYYKIMISFEKNQLL
jgi:hypothetical protein